MRPGCNSLKPSATAAMEHPDCGLKTRLPEIYVNAICTCIDNSSTYV